MLKNLTRVTMAAALVLCGLSSMARADDGGRRRTYQTANIIDFHTGVAVGGAVTMYRGINVVDAAVATSGLDQNAAYTVWWVVFNRPNHCVGGCGEDDLARPEVRPSVFYAAGFVTGNDGTANVTAHLEAGALPEGVDVLLGRGLHRGNGLRAEIHLVVRSHGPIIPGMVDKQISTFDPACAVCDDEQAAVLLPPQ
jgi:hypothetical protein